MDLSQHASEAINLALLCFAAADVFVREPPLVSLTEQTVRLRSELLSEAMLMQQLKICTEQKLRRSIADFQIHLLQQLLGTEQPAD